MASVPIDMYSFILNVGAKTGKILHVNVMQMIEEFHHKHMNNLSVLRHVRRSGTSE